MKRFSLASVFPIVHRGIYRASNGRLGTLGGKMVLLTTTGRRSGKQFTTPLSALETSDGLVLIASNNGGDHHPNWYLNLVANPSVKVQRGRELSSMTARTATAEEKADLWPKILAWMPRYDGYTRRTAREIPVIVLSKD